MFVSINVLACVSQDHRCATCLSLLALYDEKGGKPILCFRASVIYFDSLWMLS